jgi:pimeloyl-ACP methyl ester carboxylesterase
VPDLPRSVGKSSPTSHTYFSERLRLHYLDWGNEEAPPLLLVHGNQDHCHNWDWLAERLRDTYHVMAPDLRGHGDSQWNVGSAYSHSEYVYDVAQLVRQTGSAPVRIVAHSLGGGVSLRYAGVFPDEVVRLVCIDGYGRPPHVEVPPVQERLRGWVQRARDLAGRIPRRYATLEEAYARMREANPRLSDEQARHLTIHGSNQNEDGTYSWKFDNYVHLHNEVDLSDEDTRTIWGLIECPVLLISGADSPFDRKGDELVGYFRNARHELVAGAGHWVHHDQLDIVTDLVRDFLR